MKYAELKQKIEEIVLEALDDMNVELPDKDLGYILKKIAGDVADIVMQNEIEY